MTESLYNFVSKIRITVVFLSVPVFGELFVNRLSHINTILYRYHELSRVTAEKME
jgi:hypothetical protein